MPKVKLSAAQRRIKHRVDTQPHRTGLAQSFETIVQAVTKRQEKRGGTCRNDNCSVEASRVSRGSYIRA